MKASLPARIGAAFVLSLALGLLAGCGRVNGEATPQPGGDRAGRSAGEGAPPEDRGIPEGDPLVALARDLYAALARGDTRPIEACLTDGVYDVLVDEGTGEAGQWYHVYQPGERPDWSPLLRWAESRPPSSLRRAYADPSPHDPHMALVTLELERGYFYLLVQDGRTVTKVFASAQPVEWD